MKYLSILTMLLIIVCQPAYSYDLCQIQDYTPEFKTYERNMHSAFYRNLPGDFANSQPISIRFFLLPDGIIKAVQISDSCGNPNLDFACLDAVLCSSPLAPPPKYKKFPPPPPADKMVPARSYGSDAYIFTFQPNKGKTLPSKSFKLRKIPLEVAYRYPSLFTPQALESEENYTKIPSKWYLQTDFFEDLRNSWPLFYQSYPNASKQEIIDWANQLFKMFVGDPTIAE